MSKTHVMNEPAAGNGPRAWQPVGARPAIQIPEVDERGRSRFKPCSGWVDRYAGLPIANWPAGNRHQRTRKGSED